MNGSESPEVRESESPVKRSLNVASASSISKVAVAAKDIRTSGLPDRRTWLAWSAFGIATQIGFAATVPFLIWFMLWGASTTTVSATWSDVAVDVALILAFAVPHSIFLAPPVRRLLARFMPRELFGCWFCLVSCVTLAALFIGWHPLPGELWHVTGVAGETVVLVMAGLAWLALLYSMWLGGLGYQTGATGLIAWLRRQPEPQRTLCRRGAYQYLRHPIYLSFLLIAWITPVMTTAHLLLSVGLTIYIAVGSWLKDRRLTMFIGDEYRAYMAEVPGFPLVPMGPLGVVRAGTR
jgi:protein-S-isoprenylcysteine O-methyltransferase Ste14